MDMVSIMFLSLAAVAVAGAVLLFSRLSSERSERRSELDSVKDSYEGKLDSLRAELSEANSDKAVLESKLAARLEFEENLAESHEAALKAKEESAEKTLLSQKESAEKALAAQKEASEAALKALKESQEANVKALREAYEKDLQRREASHAKELEQMKDSFKALSAENSERFKTQSAESIGDLLKPITEKFAEFDKSVRESQKEAAAHTAALKENIEKVMRQSDSVGEKADNLANAITGYSKIQGDFGEMLLTDVLKNAGLVEGVHYVTQSVMTDDSGHEIKSESGRTMIPDVIVYYPDDTAVIIDSKVSLNSYKEYLLATSVEEKHRLAKAHAESVTRHVEELRSKDYASYLPKGKRKVDFNIMFIPMEGAFRLMLEASPTLWQAARDRNVLVVSQMTLIIVLNMIQMAWRQMDQEKNIEEVYKTASEMMSQLKGWMDHYVKVGEALEKARGEYAESKKKLVDSNQSVVRKIEKLESLSLAPKKSARGKIKATSRLNGPESIIPKELSPDGIQE